MDNRKLTIEKLVFAAHKGLCLHVFSFQECVKVCCYLYNLVPLLICWQNKQRLFLAWFGGQHLQILVYRSKYLTADKPVLPLLILFTKQFSGKWLKTLIWSTTCSCQTTTVPPAVQNMNNTSWRRHAFEYTAKKQNEIQLRFY